MIYHMWLSHLWKTVTLTYKRSIQRRDQQHIKNNQPDLLRSRTLWAGGVVGCFGGEAGQCSQLKTPDCAPGGNAIPKILGIDSDAHLLEAWHPLVASGFQLGRRPGIHDPVRARVIVIAQVDEVIVAEAVERVQRDFVTDEFHDVAALDVGWKGSHRAGLSLSVDDCIIPLRGNDNPPATGGLNNSLCHQVGFLTLIGLHLRRPRTSRSGSACWVLGLPY